MEQHKGPTRRLTTVLATDVVGYSKMAARDEERAVQLLRQRFDTITALVSDHAGRVFNTAGDALFAEFSSPVEAVRCALEAQEAMATANHRSEEVDRLQLRMGINLGDVIINGSDLLGDGVNVAARLESLAPPGGICVSSNVYEQLVGKLTLGAEDLGEQHVKNIPRPIHAYRLTPEGAPPAAPAPASKGGRARLRMRIVVPALAGLVAIAALAAAATHWLDEPPQVSASVRQARPLVPEDVPFIDDAFKDRIRNVYLPAPPSKALALAEGSNVASYVTQRIDSETARKDALERCTAQLHVVKPNTPANIGCRLYAVEDEVVWTLRSPPMPAQPWVAATRPVPTVQVDPNKVPLISESGRQVVATKYVPGEPAKAFAIGRRGVVYLSWKKASDSGAMRNALELCGAGTGAPCFIYAVGDDVMVHVPATVRIVDVWVPGDLAGVSDVDRHRVEATYVPDGSWRAMAIGANGRIGLGLGLPSEEQAIAQAVRDCEQSGGVECRLAAVGPFKVERR